MQKDPLWYKNDKSFRYSYAPSQNLSPSNSDVIQDLAAGRLRADAVEVDDDAGHFMEPGEERCFLMAFGLHWYAPLAGFFKERVALRSFFSVEY